jgi:hypothetical protein
VSMSNGLTKSEACGERPAENRRYQRFEFETDLTACAVGTEHSETARGCSLNINEAGLAGLFPIEWLVGARVTLQFSVPFTTAPVKVKAVIRNRTSYRYGFEFVDMSAEHRGTISRTCKMLGLFS